MMGKSSDALAMMDQLGIAFEASFWILLDDGIGKKEDLASRWDWTAMPRAAWAATHLDD